MSEAPVETSPRTSPRELFVAFSGIALCGFGGVLPFVHRELVDRRRWLSPEEFARLLSMSQVMPGPTICNLSVLFGDRMAGLPGAAACLAGIVALPMAIVIALAAGYAEVASHPFARRALAGMAFVAAGLVVAVAVKMTRALPRHPASFVLTGLAFVAVGIGRVPLVGAIAVLAPLGIASAWRARW
jgi:chromate transporter